MAYTRKSFFVPVLNNYWSSSAKLQPTESVLKASIGFLSSGAWATYIQIVSFKNKNSAVMKKENILRTRLFHGSSFMKYNF